MFIDLFSGCGGFSLGLSKAGWRGLFAVEKDDLAFDTFQTNLINGAYACYDWPDWLNRSTNDIESILKQHRVEIESLNGQISLLVGSPPCQGFSMAGRRNPKDPRNRLTEKYLEFVRLVEPRYLVLENVQGINMRFLKAKAHKAPYSAVVREKLLAAGYKVFSNYIDASDFGVPQKRTRFFILGFRKDCDLPPDFDPFERLNELRSGFLKTNGLPDRKISVKEAIGDLEQIRNGTEPHPEWWNRGFRQIAYKPPKKPNEYVAYCREGMNGLVPDSLRLARHKPATIEYFERIRANSRSGIELSKKEKEVLGIKKQAICVLDEAQPSKTVTTLPDDLLHYSEPRILTVREIARIQSFPDNFQFKGNYTTGSRKRTKECPRYTQVGNAVPPLLGQAIGHLLMSL